MNLTPSFHNDPFHPGTARALPTGTGSAIPSWASPLASICIAANSSGVASSPRVVPRATVTLTAPQAGPCITLSHRSSLKIGANTSVSRWNSLLPLLSPPPSPHSPFPVRQTPYGRTLCNVKSLQSGQPVLGEISYVTRNKESGNGTCPH